MKFGSTAIEDKVFPYTLNVEWWKLVGKQFRNSVLNMTECEKNVKWEKKLADVPYIFFYQPKMKP